MSRSWNDKTTRSRPAGELIEKVIDAFVVPLDGRDGQHYERVRGNSQLGPQCVAVSGME